ncbi:hypothetical protein AB5J56_22620 [Streptomyces sp. R21]|uniref:Uncharacterized protein n=1 Tax=Streptomyces sp. R21 TaxID=3238627 RepID=A0AB39PNG3_9ACTN
MDVAGDVIIAALALRVFGRDAVTLLRRVAAAGVRAGISEIRRDGISEMRREELRDADTEGQA